MRRNGSAEDKCARRDENKEELGKKIEDVKRYEKEDNVNRENMNEK